MRTTSYTDLRNNLKGYLDRVVDDCETLVVHRPANTSVVIVSMDEWNAVKETEYLTSSPEMMEWLHKAEENMNAGKGIMIDIDAL